MGKNILLITLDQFRGDSLGCVGHPLVKTPALDHLATNGTLLKRHYSQSSPCAPGRASLYTGMYQMNHRVLANGTPLDDSFDNVARMAARNGYTPALFGYTDQSVDPRVTLSPDDPRLLSYEAVLPGFELVLDLTQEFDPWVAMLAAHNVDTSVGFMKLLATENERPADLSISTFLTNEFLQWRESRAESWFAHLSYFRPHPPYSAAGEFSTMYDPADVDLPIAPAETRHPLHEYLLTSATNAAPSDEAKLRRMRSQYYGMISEVDSQLGRIWDALKKSGEWENTMIVIASDHGEMLGDHGLREKVGYWEESHHIVGIVRDPVIAASHGKVVEQFTENVDILPTICDYIGAEIPTQCNGRSLYPLLSGDQTGDWRTHAAWEFDWSHVFIDSDNPQWNWSRDLTRCSLAVLRSATHGYVQFADGEFLCFDLKADPTWRTPETDINKVFELSRTMNAWRMQNNRHEFTGFIVADGGKGRWPSGVPWRTQ
jgi:arylsulfatase A-like enzyme